MADDASGEGVGPSGAFAFSGDGEFGSCGSEQGEGEFSQNCQVFRAVILAVSGAVLVEGHIQHPMQGVLDGPVGADGGSETFGAEAGRGQVVHRVADAVGAGLDPAMIGVNRLICFKVLLRVGPKRKCF